VWLVTIAPLIAIFGLLLYSGQSLPLTPTRTVGYILLITGIVVLTIARFNLGNSFSVQPKARELVTSGIYSKFRHPVYVFSGVALAGAALVADRPLLLVLLIPLAFMQIRRARKEEAVLHAAFGKRYEEYRRNTWL
jgi:protein-S-isoprenylcysteine O-methyltransferase Ste14